MSEKIHKILGQVEELILDKKRESRLALTCLLAEGHLLIEDLPGVGKTTLVQVLAKLLGLEFSRIQFTSDLLPADIIGNSIFNDQTQKFQFHPGPIFSQLVLADELNRANPRTQSALLQAMEEGDVSVDGKSTRLPDPFFVIATQNPQKQIGTYPLPESQLDRFLMSLELNFASKASEMQLIQGFNPRERMAQLAALISESEFADARQQVKRVHLSEKVARYISDILDHSRSAQMQGHSPLSTRSGMALGKASRAYAYLQSRDAVTIEDVQQVAVSVLSHRLGGSHGLKRGRELAEKLIAAVAVAI